MEQIHSLKDYAITASAMEDIKKPKPTMIDITDAPQDDLLMPESPTTLDITAAPDDELLMEFSSAASASNTASNFVALTKGPDLFALPLSAGIAVSGILVNDPTTLTEPFLPGEHVLACLIPPKPVLLSAHEDKLRLRIQTNAALEIPDTMLPEAATSYMTSLLVAASILKEQLHIPIVRTPTASPDPAAESGIGTYNNKRILVVGGQTSLGSAMVQLLRRALPDTKVLVTSTIHDRAELQRRTNHLVSLGATYAVDGAIDELDVVLPPSVDIIINAVRGGKVRKEILGLLEGLQRFVDCNEMDIEAAVSGFLELEPDCVTTLHEELLRAANVFGEVEEPC